MKFINLIALTSILYSCNQSTKKPSIIGTWHGKNKGEEVTYKEDSTVLYGTEVVSEDLSKKIKFRYMNQDTVEPYQLQVLAYYQKYGEDRIQLMQFSSYYFLGTDTLVTNTKGKKDTLFRQ